MWNLSARAHLHNLIYLSSYKLLPMEAAFLFFRLTLRVIIPVVQLDPEQAVSSSWFGFTNENLGRVYHRGLGGKVMKGGVFSVCRRPGKPLAGEHGLESLVHSSALQSCQTNQLDCSSV